MQAKQAKQAEQAKQAKQTKLKEGTPMDSTRKWNKLKISFYILDFV